MYYVRWGLHGPGWHYVLGMPRRADVPLRPPKAGATDLGRGPNFRMGYWWAPYVPRSREHERRLVAGRGKNVEGRKNTFMSKLLEEDSTENCLQ